MLWLVSSPQLSLKLARKIKLITNDGEREREGGRGERGREGEEREEGRKKKIKKTQRAQTAPLTKKKT